MNLKIFELFDTEVSGEQGSPRIAFTILSALAEGTDRLVAHEVLRLPDSMLEAVLPLTKEDYLQDFETEESKKEFEELCQSARNVIALKDGPLSVIFSTTDLTESRKKAYEDVGRYIVVAHSDVLITVWDGMRHHVA